MKKYFVLLSDTNIFTDKAYIRISGTSAAGSKRGVTRFDWAKTELSSIGFETAGDLHYCAVNFYMRMPVILWETLFPFVLVGVAATDADCELKFLISNYQISIDIDKSQQLEGIKLYRLMTKLCMVQQENARLLAFTSKIPAIHINLTDGAEAGKTITSAITTFIDAMVSKYDPVSYKEVFDSCWR